MQNKSLKITDTTFRDAHQSLMATRLRIEDMEPIASDMDSLGLQSVEVWGGATFDAATRYLAEDPWDRLRTFKRLMPSTPLMMLLRGQNLVGYRNYPNDVVDAFVKHASETGIDVFRIFDALNDERNLEQAVSSVKDSGKHVQMAICYSVTEESMGGSIYNLDYYVSKAKKFHDMGADSICLKDMGGLMTPYDAYHLVSTLKSKLDIPLQLHTHYTSGMASMTVLKAIEAGVDVVDACLAPLALRTSQPAIEPLVLALKDTERSINLDLSKLIDMGDYLESILPKYSKFLDSPKVSVIDTKVLHHQIPGGMMSNLVEQLREAGAVDRLNDVLAEVVKTRRELGYPPLVTPVSQMIGSQAVNNVRFGRYKIITNPIKDYFYGLYGTPPGEVDPVAQSSALEDYHRGSEPMTGPSSSILGPEMDKARDEIIDLSANLDDILTYAIYPTTGRRFLEIKYGKIPIPDEMQPPMVVDNTVSSIDLKDLPPKSVHSRLFNVYVDGQFFQVEVDPANPESVAAASSSKSPLDLSKNFVTKSTEPEAVSISQGPKETPQTSPKETSQVLAPMPGVIIRYVVKEGESVAEGDSVVVLEAMKMESVLPSPVSGTVESLPFTDGFTVTTGDVLAVISI